MDAYLVAQAAILAAAGQLIAQTKAELATLPKSNTSRAKRIALTEQVAEFEAFKRRF